MRAEMAARVSVQPSEVVTRETVARPQSETLGGGRFAALLLGMIMLEQAATWAAMRS